MERGGGWVNKAEEDEQEGKKEPEGNGKRNDPEEDGAEKFAESTWRGRQEQGAQVRWDAEPRFRVSRTRRSVDGRRRLAAGWDGG